MTPKQSKTYILNNLDKYIIDKRGDFINIKKDYSDSDYIIWKSSVEDYEEVREKVIKEIFKDKRKWELVNNIDKGIVATITSKDNNNREIIGDLVEEILLEKENWEIVYETRQSWWYGTVNIRPISYKHLPTGKEVSNEIFFFSENYILGGELGCREGKWKDYEKKRGRKLWEWRGNRKREKVNLTDAASQPELLQTQNQTPAPEPTNPETEQENQNSTSTFPVRNEHETPPPQQAETAAQANAQQEEERLKKEREEQAKKAAEEKKKQESETKKQAEEQAKQQELTQKKDKVITEITTALNQEPQLANSDLSPQYQNWEAQINQLTDLQKITNLQERILADIQARRKDKITAQEVKENLHKAQTGTKEEQQQAWENLEKKETESSYQENQAEVENLKKQKAAQNPQEYGEKAQKRIEQKLQENEIKETDLNQENQQELKRLKNGQIQDPDQLVATETKIKQNIYQVEAQQKITNFTAQVNQVLKSKVKSQITTLKKQLLAFISSSNIYYSTQKQVAEKLLAQLENYSTTDNNQKNNSVKSKSENWKIIVLLLPVGIVLLITLIILIKKVAKRREK